MEETADEDKGPVFAALGAAFSRHGAILPDGESFGYIIPAIMIDAAEFTFPGEVTYQITDGMEMTDYGSQLTDDIAGEDVIRLENSKTYTFFVTTRAWGVILTKH